MDLSFDWITQQMREFLGKLIGKVFEVDCGPMLRIKAWVFRLIKEIPSNDLI